MAALTLAMAGAGVASHDKAKIGRNLHQGVNNLANGITSLTGSLTTPILQLRNDGAGPALSLGTPPDHFNRPVQTANGDAWQAEIGGPGPLVVGAYAICADVN